MSWRTRWSAAEMFNRFLDERGIDDLLDGQQALHEPVLDPPLDLLLDVGDPEPAVAILVGQSGPDELGLGPGVLRGDLHHVLVVGAGRRPPVLHHQRGVVVIARGLHVALHEGDRLLAVGGELLRVEDGGDLPGVEVAGPEEHLAEPLRLGGARERLRHQDGVHGFALERLHRGGHGLERDDAHVPEREPLPLQDIADVVVKRGAELGHADGPALEVLDRAHLARVPQLLLDHDAHQRKARPLAALVGDDPELLPLEHDVVERGGEAGGANLDRARRERGGDGRRGLEVDQLRLHAELLEEALLDAHEDGRGRRELEDAHLDLGLGAGGGSGEKQRDRQNSGEQARHGVSFDECAA